jgi:tetratricopeptide (TPR) repeat protein
MSLFRLPSFFVLLFALCAAGQADPPFDAARQAFINGAADGAVGSLRNSIASDPSSADAHNLLCRVFYSEERWDSAITECERAVALNSKRSLFQLWLGRAYGLKAEHASWFTAIGLAKKTRNSFEKAVDLDERNVEARSDLSEYYIEAPGFLGGGVEKAAAQANAVEPLEPATALYIRARIAEHEKRNSDAEQEYKRAVQLNGNPHRRLIDLASFYRRVNRLDEMESAIKKSAELNIHNDSALVDSAGLLLRAGRNLALASDLVHRYIDQGTKSEDTPLFQAQYLLGQILERQGNVQAAKQAYQAAQNNASDFAPAASALKHLGAS